MESTNTFSLSIEELLLVLHLIGETEVASALLQLTVGELTAQDLESRFTAAGHSLMARGLLRVNVAAEQKELDPVLVQSVRLLAEAEFSLRVGKITEGAEKVLQFFCGHQLVISHEIQDGVVHHLTCYQDLEPVIAQVQHFLGMEGLASRETPEVLVGAELVEQLGSLGEAPLEHLRVTLEMAGVPQELSNQMAEDCQNTRYLGSILRVNYLDSAEGKQPVAEQGCLAMASSQRLWLFQQAEEHPEHFRLIPGSAQRVAELVRDLVRKVEVV